MRSHRTFNTCSVGWAGWTRREFSKTIKSSTNGPPQFCASFIASCPCGRAGSAAGRRHRACRTPGRRTAAQCLTDEPDRASGLRWSRPSGCSGSRRSRPGCRERRTRAALRTWSWSGGGWAGTCLLKRWVRRWTTKNAPGSYGTILG